MTNDSASASDSPTNQNQPRVVEGTTAPPLAPGYHFTISLCEAVCTREQFETIKDDLIETARNLIFHHDLRGPDGNYINTRVHANRTAPLLEEMAAQGTTERSAGQSVEQALESAP